MKTAPVSTTDLTVAVPGKWFQKKQEGKIRHLLIDSRRSFAGAETLFIAIKGPRHDGHRFLQACYERGVRHFMISDPRKAYGLDDANIYLVEDTLTGFHDLVAWHRSRLNIPVVAITGSNGKTVVKEWLFQVLKDLEQVTRSPRSYNSQVGVPLSVWMLNAADDTGIIEAGISLPGEMGSLARMIRPTCGIFTNIGSAHSENFESPLAKAREKAKLFAHAKSVVYCFDHKEIRQAISEIGPEMPAAFTWGYHAKADVKLLSVTPFKRETGIKARWRNNDLSIVIPFTDQASIENALHCWAYLLKTGVPNEYIAARMKLLTPIAMRLELMEGINNTSVINDVYSSDLDSLEIALDFMRQQKHHSRQTVILSEIDQSGMHAEELYRQVAGLLQHYQVDHFIGIGKEMEKHESLFRGSYLLFSDTGAFTDAFEPTWFGDETILVKGARRFSFERISRLLQEKAHETVLEINLEAFRENLNYYRSKLSPHTRLMVMVKAFSYGSGTYEVANLLEYNRADYLAVAYTDEGIELRKAGISLPIMVMNPDISSYESVLHYRLEPEIYSFRVLKAFTKEVERHAMAVPYPIHLKIDTGMHRLGFDPDQLHELIGWFQTHHALKVCSVFSHLAGSDDPDHDAFSEQQIAIFRNIGLEIKKHLGDGIRLHILNSAGISRFPEAHFDMVRLGIGLYGITNNAEDENQLQQVSTLKTVISQIKHIKKGETVGYGRKGVAEKNLKLATLPVGYADGLNRKLGNGNGRVFIKGKPAPIIGNVCMDMCMVNITEISAAEGDEVIIFGKEQSVNQLAELLETIPYEVLTSISRRVKRVYFTE